MNARDTTLRRNFIIATVAHAALIGGLIAWELFAPSWSSSSTPSEVELVVPADILGDLPKGPGHGKGAYAPPPPDQPAEPAGNPSPAMAQDESPSPKQPAPASLAPNEVAISKKTATPVKKLVAAAPSKSKSTNTVKVASSVSTAKSTGPSAEQIRQRFLKALGGGEPGGTPYGDGKPAGGGSGKSKVIGSPDGSPDGVVGGTGPGSPNWQYFLHVHDKMYEAWEQPGSVTDKKLVAVVVIKVARDGSIVGVTLKRSSGNKLMDNSALAAARKVRLLEPPPDVLVKGAAAEISVDFQMEG